MKLTELQKYIYDNFSEAKFRLRCAELSDLYPELNFHYLKVIPQNNIFEIKILDTLEWLNRRGNGAQIIQSFIAILKNELPPAQRAEFIQQYRQKVISEHQYLPLPIYISEQKSHQRPLEAKISITQLISLQVVANDEARRQEEARAKELERKLKEEQLKRDAPPLNSAGSEPEPDEGKKPPRPTYVPPPIPIEAQKAAGEHAKLIFWGKAGMGKSTLLHYLAYQEANKPDGYIPIFVSLKAVTSLGNTENISIQEYVLEQIYQKNKEMGKALEYYATPSRETVTSTTTEPKIWWLLDGLDEVGSLAPKIVAEAKNLPGKVTITSRPVDLWELADFKQFDLQKISFKDVEQFIHLWFDQLTQQTIPAANKTEIAQQLLTHLRENPALAQLVENPLLLFMFLFIAVDYRGGAAEVKEIAQEAKLYEPYIDKIIHSELKKIDQTPWPTPTTRQAEATITNLLKLSFAGLGWILQTAYYAQAQNEPTEINIQQKLTTYLATQPGLEAMVQDPHLSQWLFNFWQNSGLLRPLEINDQTYYFFAHQTFQEYGVACFLHEAWQKDRHQTWQFLAPQNKNYPYATRLHHPAWQEPLRLLAQKMSGEELETFINCLWQHPSPDEKYLHRDLLLVPNWLHNLPSIKNYLLNPIVKRLNLLILPELTRSLFIATINAFSNLGSAGGQEIIALGKYFHEYTGDDIKKIYIQALVKIGGKEEVAILGNLLSFSNRRWKWARDALGEINSKEATVELIKAILKNCAVLDDEWGARTSPFHPNLSDISPLLIVLESTIGHGKKFELSVEDGKNNRDELQTSAIKHILNQLRIVESPKYYDDLDNITLVQRLAIQTLRKVGYAQAIPVLISTMLNPGIRDFYHHDYEPVEEALIQIGRLTPPQELAKYKEQLKEQLNKITDPYYKHRIHYVLFGWGEFSFLNMIIINDWENKYIPDKLRTDSRYLDNLSATIAYFGPSILSKIKMIFMIIESSNYMESAKFVRNKIFYKALVKIGNEQAIDLLIKQIEKDVTAIIPLCELGHPKATPFIIERLNRNNFYIWTGLITALGELKEPLLLDFMYRTVREKYADYFKRLKLLISKETTWPLFSYEESYIAVIKVLGSIGNLETVNLLGRIIKRDLFFHFKYINPKKYGDPRYENQMLIAIVEALGNIGRLEAVEILIYILQQNLSFQLNQATVNALGQIKSPNAVNVLTQFFEKTLQYFIELLEIQSENWTQDNHSEYLRTQKMFETIIQALGQIHIKEVTIALIEFANKITMPSLEFNIFPDVQSALFVALLQSPDFYSDKNFSSLVRKLHLNDKYKEIGEEILSQIQLANETAIKQISIDSYVKRIVHREGEKCIDIFLNELKTCEPEERGLWIGYLQQFGKRENGNVINALKPFLYEENLINLIKEVIKTLAKSLLKQFSKRENGDITNALKPFFSENLIKEAIEALAKIGDVTVFDDLISFLKSRKHEEHHNAIKKALGEIGVTVTDTQELEKVRQVLWQTRFEGDPEVNWVAYKQVVARLTELQVDELAQKEPLLLPPGRSPLP